MRSREYRYVGPNKIREAAQRQPAGTCILLLGDLQAHGKSFNRTASPLCPPSRERNAVKDSRYYCALCDAELPERWNFKRHTTLGNSEMRASHRTLAVAMENHARRLCDFEPLSGEV